MTGLAWAFVALFVGVAALDWVAVARRPDPGARALETVAKPAALGVLVVAALVLDPQDGAQRAWFVAGLLLSLAGDVFLLPVVDRFVFGLASFLFAHLAYVAGFLVDPDGSAAGLVLGLLLVAAGTLTLGRRVVGGALANERALAGPVIAYVAAISAMVVAAAMTGDPLAVAGALLFYGSDSLIGLGRFDHPREWYGLAIMVTYHLGQLALVVALTT